MTKKSISPNNKTNNNSNTRNPINNYYKPNNTIIAMNIISKKQLTKLDLVSIRKEASLLNQLNHPNIIKLLDSSENYKTIYLMQEYFNGSTLYDYFKLKNYYISENIVKIIIRKLLLVVSYLQERNIVHRDLKLENILISRNTQKINDLTYNINMDNNINTYININGDSNKKCLNNDNMLFSKIRGNRNNISSSCNKSIDSRKLINFDIKVIDFGLARYLGSGEVVVNEPYGTLVRKYNNHTPIQYIYHIFTLFTLYILCLLLYYKIYLWTLYYNYRHMLLLKLY